MGCTAKIGWLSGGRGYGGGGFSVLCQGRAVAFLKVDVEGFELHAIPSSKTLLESKQVENLLVEFGPPQRWHSAAKDTAKDGLALLRNMHVRNACRGRG